MLTRPANLITALADILAGISLAGYWQYVYSDSQIEVNLIHVGLLLVSTIGLYGGGVVFNDVFDFKLDQVERPERPLPSGSVPFKHAVILGILLLVIGICTALLVNIYCGCIALITALLTLLYDAVSKHSQWAGPLNMGLCRGGNLLLGVSIIPFMLEELYFVAIVPILYIGAITLISRGEVHGGNRVSIALAFLLYALAGLLIVKIGYHNQGQVWVMLLFLGLLYTRIIPPLVTAYRTLLAQDIFKAVKTGVISLIVVDASLAAASSGWIWGLVILALLPLSMTIAKYFAVT